MTASLAAPPRGFRRWSSTWARGGFLEDKKNQAKVSEVAEECREAELPDYTREEALANDRLMTAMKKT